MFTGIIEEVGLVDGVTPLGNGRGIRINAVAVLDDLALGDSIAIDGVCQTVTNLSSGGFEVQSVATTLERTTFGELAPGRPVNLERALALGQRLGGHLVQGHVDAVGEVISIQRRDELVLLDFTMPEAVAGVTILHGSITVNGISFTVNSLPRPGVAQISIIPFTWTHTAVSDLRVGQRVNLEGDLIGKYVRQLLGAPGAEPPVSADLLRIWGYTERK